MYYRVPPKGVRLVGGVWVIPSATRGLTLFSYEPRHKRPSSPPLSIPSRRNRSLYIELGARIHNLIGGSQTHHKSAKQSNRLGFQEPKSKKLLTFHPTESSPRTQTDAPNAMARTQSAQILLSQIPPKQHKLWRNMRGRTKRKSTNEPQDLDPKSSPHLEERLIGGVCRSRSPLSNPSRICKNRWRNREEGQAFQGQQWRREKGQASYPRKKKGRGIYSPSQNMIVAACSGRIFQISRGGFFNNPHPLQSVAHPTQRNTSKPLFRSDNPGTFRQRLHSTSCPSKRPWSQGWW